MSVVLKLFYAKDPQDDMCLATDPHLKIFSSRDPPKQHLSYKCSLKKIHIFKDFHTFSRLFKNSRSTSECRAASLYICYFSIAKITRAPPWALVTQSHFPTPCDAPEHSGPMADSPGLSDSTLSHVQASRTVSPDRPLCCLSTLSPLFIS